MFKLRKTCALLCSSMCALGTGASAKNPGRLNMKGVVKANSSAGVNPKSMKFMDKYQAQLDSFLDSQRKEAEKAKSKSAPIGAETALLGGSYFGETKESVWARGKLSVLDDPEVLENFRKLEVNYFESKTKGKKLNSHLVYWLCKQFLSIAVTGGIWLSIAVISQFLNIVATERVKNYIRKKIGFDKNPSDQKLEAKYTALKNKVIGIDRYGRNVVRQPSQEEDETTQKIREYAESELGLAANARRSSLALLLLLAIPVAGGFNYLSQKQWGQGLEFEALAEKIKEVKENIEKDAAANEQKLKNNSVKKVHDKNSNRNKRTRTRKGRSLPKLMNNPNVKQNPASNQK